MISEDACLRLVATSYATRMTTRRLSRPRRVRIRSMIGYGGTLTLYGLIGHVVTNLEKVLLGSFWGSGGDSRRPCK